MSNRKWPHSVAPGWAPYNKIPVELELDIRREYQHFEFLTGIQKRLAATTWAETHGVSDTTFRKLELRGRPSVRCPVPLEQQARYLRLIPLYRKVLARRPTYSPKSIAKRHGVSQTTVRRVINDLQKLKGDTRKCSSTPKPRHITSLLEQSYTKASPVTAFLDRKSTRL